MRQRLRRALRKGAKNGIEIEKSTDPKTLKLFMKFNLYHSQLIFMKLSQRTLTKQFEAFAPMVALSSIRLKLAPAKMQEPVSRVVVSLLKNFMIFYGNEASYHHTFLSEPGTKFIWRQPLLHLEAMRDARSRVLNAIIFGVSLMRMMTNQRFYGVSVFKRGFMRTS